MEIRKLSIFSASQKLENEETLLEKTLQAKHFRYIDVVQNHLKNNTMSLAKVYNLAIAKALRDNSDVLLLIHDDVIIEEDPIPKLVELFDDYDLVGVAGTSKIELKAPALWHLMGGGFGSGNLHGCVQHRQYKRYEHSPMQGYYITPKTEFGLYPHRVVMIDGVFMALNRNVMKNIRFDEDYPSKFHFYDLDYSLNAHMNGCKVGVGDILITHASPGLREYTPEWLEGQKYFLNKYES